MNNYLFLYLMAKSYQLENPFVKLGKSELITTIAILLFRFKFPSEFNYIYSSFTHGSIPDELQFVIILMLGLTLGLLFNLVVESADITIVNFLYGKKIMKQEKTKIEEIVYRICRFFKVTKVKNKIDNGSEKSINDLIEYYKNKDSNWKYHHYFIMKENHFIFYNLVRTFGNRYSKICETDSAEKRYKTSAFFSVYGGFFILILIMLLKPPIIDFINLILIVCCLIGILFFFKGAAVTVRRLSEFMMIVLEELDKVDNVFEK